MRASDFLAAKAALLFFCKRLPQDSTRLLTNPHKASRTRGFAAKTKALGYVQEEEKTDSSLSFVVVSHRHVSSRTLFTLHDRQSYYSNL